MKIKLVLITTMISVLLLGMFPLSAFADDTCSINVKSDIETLEVTKGSGRTDVLSEYFTDTEGHSLTYSVVEADDSLKARVQDGKLLVNPLQEGEFDVKVSATCAVGEKTVQAVIPYNVVLASDQGDPAQYNYDETPAESVKVYATIASDGVPLMAEDGTVLARVPVEVPYFDLAAYGLEEFHRCHTEDGQGEYIDDDVVERPTMLHLYIYMTEKYYMGLPEDQCGNGSSGVLDATDTNTIKNMFGEDAYDVDGNILNYSGGSTSIYFTSFWGHDCNLNYYRNHLYPLMYGGWGATADYALLSDNDVIDVAMFTDWGFFGNDDFGFCKFDQDQYEISAGKEHSFQTYRVTGDIMGSAGSFDVIPDTDLDVRIYDDDWEQVAVLDCEDDKFSYTFENPGTYHIIGLDFNQGTEDACKMPAIADITVNEVPVVKAKVDFTSQMNGRFLHAPQVEKEVSSDLAEQYGYTDEVNGVSALDVLVAAHELTFGDDFKADTAQDYLKIKDNNVEKQFGVDPEEGMMGDIYRGGFYVNHSFPNDGTEFDNGYDWVEYNGTVVGTQEVKNGDLVEFFFYENEFMADTYTWFTDEDGQYSRDFRQCAGEDLTLILNGFYAAEGRRCKDEEELVDYDGAHELADQQLYIVNMETGAKTEIEDAVTDEDGEVTLNFDQPGEYVITAYGEDDYGMMTPIMTLTTITVDEHDWEWETTKEPTLDEDGKKERTCSICGKHEEEVIPKLQEAIVDVRLNAEAGEPAKIYKDLYVRSDTAYNAGFEKFDDKSTITMADAAVAAHIAEYGDAFKGDTTGEVLDAQMVVMDTYGFPWTTKIFNSTKSNSVWLNNEFAMSGIFDVAVEDGDLVSVELYESTDYSDTYLYIDKDEYENDEAGYVDVKLTAMIMDEFYNYNPEPVEGATIVLTGNDNDSLFEAETDEDGIAHVLVDFAGSYTVSVEDVPYDNPWLPQTAEAVVAENAHTFKVARKTAIEDIRTYAEENEDKADPKKIEIAALKAENKIKDAETVEEIAAALEEGKNNIDAIVQAAEEAAQALADAKDDALEAIDQIDLSVYYEDDQEKLQDIIDAAKDAIANAETVDEVDDVFYGLMETLDGYSTAAEILDNQKADALEELDEIDPDDYIESAREQVAQLIAAAEEAIGAATTADEIDDIMNDLYEALGELETVEDVEETIEDVLAALDDEFSPEDYVEADREAAAQLIDAAKDAVANAKTIEEISGIMSDLIDKLSALTTTEEQDKALEKTKADAIAFLQNMITEDSDKVLENDKVKLEVAALKAMFAVQNAKDADSVTNIVNEAISTADKLINDKIIADETAAAKKLKVTKLKAKSKKRKFTVSWKKNTKADGYQVQYKLKSAKKFKSLKKSTTKVKVVSKKLKKGNKYIFRVRPYKTVNGKKVYGKWAKTKAVKCK